ncbi:GNAT family N-acetyltransferase [Cupriavidus basilensis]|uniref:GNAT family N-acetyltransferase n=1 Tax=Cupriavidus basilensis TaxID=68895 RepID=UPI0039F6BF00
MNFSVRLAFPEDASAISSVIIGALRETNSKDYSPEIIGLVEQNFSPTGIGSLISQRRMYVAASSREILGTASLDGDVVRSVFVAPDHQGKGIGKRLMRVIEDYARDLGIESLKVPSSVTAESFYARLGFHVLREQFHGEERTIIMELILQSEDRTGK